MRLGRPLVKADFVGADNVARIIETLVLYKRAEDQDSIQVVSRGRFQGGNDPKGTPYIDSLILAVDGVPEYPDTPFTTASIEESQNLFLSIVDAEQWGRLNDAERSIRLAARLELEEKE